MALASKKQEEEKTGKTTKDMEKQLLADTQANKEATKTVQKNVLTQKEQMQKRLQEKKNRVRSKAPRATSMNVTAMQLNNTLPLNFEGQHNRKESDVNPMNSQMPIMQSSSMLISQQEDQNGDSNVADKDPYASNINTTQPSFTSPIKSFNLGRSKFDDTTSQGNRSTTTTGGGLASRIG